MNTRKCCKYVGYSLKFSFLLCQFSTGNIIDATSGELALYKGFTSILLVSAVTCAVTFLIGVAFELLRKCHYASKKQSKVIDHEMETQTSKKDDFQRYLLL